MSDSELKGQGTNPYNGLHALNNLDIAVNGQEVNSMPSYQEVKRRSVGKHQQQKGATESSPESYSPPPPKRLLNNISAASSAGVADSGTAETEAFPDVGGLATLC